MNGEPRAQTYAKLISAFYASKSNATSLAGINDGYTIAAANPGVFSYYNASWGVPSLMAMSGNFWDLTQ